MHKRLLLEAASVKNNSAFSYYVRWQRGTARIRPLHAGRAAIDRYFLQQLTCSSGFTAVDPCCVCLCFYLLGAPRQRQPSKMTEAIEMRFGGHASVGPRTAFRAKYSTLQSTPPTITIWLAVWRSG